MKTEIGERIRRMREARELSHAEVSALTGIPVDRLEGFEVGQAIPSVGVIIQLARVLGSKVDGMLHGGPSTAHPLTVCRAGDRAGPEELEETEQGYTYRSLGQPASPGHGMEPLLITFHPGHDHVRPISHDGQEFVYVLEGQVELVHGGERRTLGPGDSAYIDATRPHLFRALGDRPSRAVGVVWSAD